MRTHVFEFQLVSFICFHVFDAFKWRWNFSFQQTFPACEVIIIIIIMIIIILLIICIYNALYIKPNLKVL